MLDDSWRGGGIGEREYSDRIRATGMEKKQQNSP